MKYLLETHHGIGDVAQYTGIIKSVREYDKDAFIGIVLNKEAYGSLLKLDANINIIYVIDFGGDKKKLLKEILRIRKQRFDYMVCSVHSAKSMEFMAVAFGAKKVVGSLLGRLEKISTRYINVPVNEPDHYVKQNYDVLHGLNPKFRFCEPYLVCPAPPYELKNHTVGLCIGTNSPAKTWPIERYIKVGEYFEKLGYGIAILGGKREAEQFNAFGYRNDKWVNLLGKTDLMESASECSQCELVIGGDTGPMHMAAAAGAKTLALFSCTDPTRHAPFSKHSYYYYAPTDCQFCVSSKMKGCTDYKCLYSIEVEVVIEIAESILKGLDSAEKYRLKYQGDGSMNG